jgi:hypothetical protein
LARCTSVKQGYWAAKSRYDTEKPSKCRRWLIDFQFAMLLDNVFQPMLLDEPAAPMQGKLLWINVIET